MDLVHFLPVVVVHVSPSTSTLFLFYFHFFLDLRFDLNCLIRPWFCDLNHSFPYVPGQNIFRMWMISTTGRYIEPCHCNRRDSLFKAWFWFENNVLLAFLFINYDVKVPNYWGNCGWPNAALPCIKLGHLSLSILIAKLILTVHFLILVRAYSFLQLFQLHSRSGFSHDSKKISSSFLNFSSPPFCIPTPS